MIIVQLVGGLGNQLSNYAFARLLKHNYPLAEIRISNDSCDFTHNGYELELAFDINNKIPICSFREYKEVSKRLPYVNHSFPFKCVRKIYNTFIDGYYSRRSDDPLIYESFSSHSQILGSINSIDYSKNYCFHGLWLSYHYPEIIGDLRKELKFRVIDTPLNKEHTQKAQEPNSVALHVRRGDYLTLYKENNILDSDYYDKAIQRIKTMIRNPCFLVFSDDLDYAEEMVKKHDVQYHIVNGNSGSASYMDMYLMSLCSNFVIANSSFSYWAALLGRTDRSVVICPKRYNTNVEMWDVPGFIKN